MSTFSGDATITDVISASASLSGLNPSGSTSVAYTAPAGRFAEVQLILASITGGGTFFNAATVYIGAHVILSEGNGSTATPTKSLEDYPTTVIINEGETVRVTLNTGSGGASSINVRIKEFNKP